MSVLNESNSTSVLCLPPDGAALVNFIWSPGWTVEDQDVLSRFISYLVAALVAALAAALVAAFHEVTAPKS
jgi:hypothetical protein